MASTMSATAHKPGSSKRLGPKGNVSRENILNAARRVFARHTYDSATLRMIGKEGGFEHPLIHYYFPTKAALFEAVMEDIVNELHQAAHQWFDGLDGKDPAQQLPMYLDRILEYDLLHPEPFKIIFLNMTQVGKLGQLPGVQLVSLIIDGMRRTLLERMPVCGDPEGVSMLNNVFCNMIIWYLGAGETQAMILGMEPAGRIASGLNRP